jgi:hypothetical protein
MHKQHLQKAGLLLLLWLTAPACLAGEEPADELAAATSSTARPGWTRLVYTGEDLPGKPTTSLELTDASMEALAVTGVQVPENTITPFTARYVRLLTVSGPGTESGTGLRIWFDGYGPDGAFRVRLRPANRAQAQATPATWTQRKDKVYRYDLDAAGCSRVIVPTLLLYTLTVSIPDTAETFLCVFQDDALYRVWPEQQDKESITVDYTVTTDAGDRRVRGERQLEKIALRVEPVTPGTDASGFELLELRDDIAVYIDRPAELPVGISGSRSLYRNIHIRLSTAWR